MRWHRLCFCVRQQEETPAVLSFWHYLCQTDLTFGLFLQLYYERSFFRGWSDQREIKLLSFVESTLPLSNRSTIGSFLSCIVRGVFLRGKFLSQKPPNWSDKWLVFVICIERVFERLPSDPEGGNGQAAFAEKALPLPKMSHNALFLSRLVKGVFLRENFLRKMLKSGLTIGPFLSYLLEGSFFSGRSPFL